MSAAGRRIVVDPAVEARDEERRMSHIEEADGMAEPTRVRAAAK
jgi:hypothetical protein